MLNKYEKYSYTDRREEEEEEEEIEKYPEMFENYLEKEHNTI